jgi:hypothetical protein
MNLPDVCMFDSLAFFSTMKMEAVRYSGSQVSVYQTTWRHISGNNILSSKSYNNGINIFLLKYFFLLYYRYFRNRILNKGFVR